MDIHVTPAVAGVLFAVAAVAGFVDTLAGGGGLITLPSLLLAGLPPVVALATSKVQSSFGSGTAALAMLRSRLVDAKRIVPLFSAALIGGTIGSTLVQRINVQALDALIPVVLITVAGYAIFTPALGNVDRRPRLTDRIYGLYIVPLIGIYDGMFGPGTGSFFAVSAIALRGSNILNATATAKVLNFGTNIASVLVFLGGGKIAWMLGLTMGIGQAVGAYFGSVAMMNGATKYIRLVIATVSSIMLIRYAWQKGLIQWLQHAHNH